jgi:hypothetical protein
MHGTALAPQLVDGANHFRQVYRCLSFWEVVDNLLVIDVPEAVVDTFRKGQIA